MLRILITVFLLCMGVPAQDRLTQLMKQLTEAPGPLGAEGPVRELMVENLKPLVTVSFTMASARSSHSKAAAGHASWWMHTWTNWARWFDTSAPTDIFPSTCSAIGWKRLSRSKVGDYWLERTGSRRN